MRAFHTANRVRARAFRWSFENRNQIHLFERSGTGHGIVPLLAAVSLEEMARLYWPFNNRRARNSTAPRDFGADAFVIKILSRRDYANHPLPPSSVSGVSRWERCSLLLSGLCDTFDPLCRVFRCDATVAMDREVDESWMKESCKLRVGLSQKERKKVWSKRRKR